MNELQQAVREFFEYLDRVEESDSGNEFHPVYISCCRAQWNESLDRILERMKELSNPVLTDEQKRAAVNWEFNHSQHVARLMLSTETSSLLCHPDQRHPDQRVVCAAMLMQDGEIVTGIRHYSPEMRKTLLRLYGVGYHLKVKDQGFVNQCGEFLTREQAWWIATEQGQIRKQVSSPGELYSENLY